MPDQQISTIYEHQVRKPGKSAPGGQVLGPTRCEIGGKVRLVGKNGKLFRKPGLPLFNVQAAIFRYFFSLSFFINPARTLFACSRESKLPCVF